MQKDNIQTVIIYDIHLGEPFYLTVFKINIWISNNNYKKKIQEITLICPGNQTKLTHLNMSKCWFPKM